MGNLNDYDFCLLHDDKIIASELEFDGPSEMYVFMNICLRNHIEFSINKYKDLVLVTEDAEE